jgi:hypothetical protein
MTLTLEVSGELERNLEFEAAELGIPVEEYAMRLLAGNRFELPPDRMPRTGAELVAYWERAGVIGSRPDITDPEAYAREMREAADRRSVD